MRQFRALDLYCGAGGSTKGLQQAGFHVTGVDIRPQKRYCGDRFFQVDALDFAIDAREMYLSQEDDNEDRLFDFIWASPPCQRYTALRSLHPERDYPDLIPETRRRLVESGIPYVIENVPGAPLGETGCLIMLCATMFGLQTKDGTGEVRRHRLFECSFSIPLRPACQHNQKSSVILVAGHCPKSVDKAARETISVTGNGMGEMGGGRAVIGIYGGRPATANERHSQRRTMSVIGSVAHANTDNTQRGRRTWTTEQAREAMGIDWMPMKSLSQAVPPAYSEWIGKRAIEFLEGRQVETAWLQS